MNYSDNQLISKMIARLNGALAGYPFIGLSGSIAVQQKQQPTQQGAPSQPGVFIERLFDRRHGSPIVSYDTGDANLSEIETQVFETTFQLSTFYPQNARNVAAPTASDLCNIVCGILQSRAIIRLFAADDIGIFRVGQVRTKYFTNDQDVQEAHPSFDFVVNYTRSNKPETVLPLLTSGSAIYPI